MRTAENIPPESQAQRQSGPAGRGADPFLTLSNSPGPAPRIPDGYWGSSHVPVSPCRGPGPTPRGSRSSCLHSVRKYVLYIRFARQFAPQRDDMFFLFLWLEEIPVIYSN